MNPIKKSIQAIMVLGVLSCGATETAVGRYERHDFTPDSSAGAGDVCFVSPDAASVTKSGAGVWTLPLSGFLGFYGEGFEIGLRSGTLKIEEGLEPDYVTIPPAVLQDAAVWLTAEKNTELDANGNVAGWYDAREASAAAVNHTYAAKHESVSGGNGVKLSVFKGMSAISFDGYVGALNKSLTLKTKSGAVATIDMCDAFYVMGIDDNKIFSPVLGNGSSGYFYSYPGKGTVLSPDGNALWQAYQCAYRHNGKSEDPTAELSLNARHACEFTTPSVYTIPIDSICRDRSLASGGRYLHEFIVFDRHLTNLERAQVTAYLVQKWKLGTDARLAIDVAEGADIEADQPTLDKIALSGSVVVRAASSADARLNMKLDYAHREQRADFRLSTAGETLETEGTEYALKIAEGDAVTVDDTSDYVRTVRNSSGGKRGVTTIDGGRRVFVVDEVPATKLTATVAAGEVVLQSPKGSVSKYYPGAPVVATSTAAELSIPQGTGGAVLNVSIPTAGDWEFDFDLVNGCGFKTDGGWTDGLNSSYYVTLTDGQGMEVFRKVVQTVKPAEISAVVPHRRYLIRDLSVGTYDFKVSGYHASTVAATLSNLAFAFVSQVRRETVVPVVGGDFEDVPLVRPYFASRDNHTILSWELTNGGLSANPCVQTVVNSMMGLAVTSAGYNFEFRGHECGRYGDNALIWIHTNSTSSVRNTATTRNATKLTAGTWQLRMNACRMTTGSEAHSRVGYDPVSSTQRCGKYPAIYSAKVTIDGGDPIDLGETDQVASFAERTYVFPNAFTVADGASVILELDQLVGWSFSLVDDFEFVRVEGDVDVGADEFGPELIVNGSFEDAGATSEDIANWARDEYTDAGNSKHGARRLDPQSEAFGVTKCDGNWCVRSFSGGRASQTLTLEEGVYRLSFWSRARFDASNEGKLSYPSALHFWFAGVGSGVTNSIVDTDTLWCSNFIQRTALFRVKTAGSYVLGFNSDNRSGTDTLTDCVSVRKVLGVATAPKVDANAEIVVKSSSADTKLRLDYTGAVTLKSLRVRGKGFYGEVSAEKYPDYFAGPGTVSVTGTPPGFLLFLR